MNTPWVQSCSTKWGDFSNSLGQSPCSVALALGQMCDTSWTLYPLPPSAKRSGHYTGPPEEEATSCRCSTVLYSLLSACGLCQNYAELISWSHYSTNCSTVFLSRFPERIPSKYSVPGWAYLDVTGRDKFDPSKAGAFKGSESLGPGIQPSSTRTPPPSTAVPRKSGLSPGAIIGIIAAFVLAALVAGLRIRWVRRRARTRPSTDNNHSHSRKQDSLHLNCLPGHLEPTCVVCKAQFTYHNNATCGMECTEILWENGGNPGMCDYCHRKPKRPGYGRCGPFCEEKAYVACLLCKARPKHGVSDLCGDACTRIAMKSAPLLLEAPQDHETYAMVEANFQQAWHSVPGHGPCPPIRSVYSIIEDEDLRQPYLAYKERVGNEQFRYHGTVRRSQCTLGVSTTALCGSAQCPLCNILESSFKVSLAKTTGAFGPGVYTSSASNKAYTYIKDGNGALILAKVVLGNIKLVSDWEEVKFCPPGYNSVVFDRMSGKLNETIVYTDDAIRPAFLIFF
ncbi:hypothetical protein FA13DRAFT_1689086 [Coprinellus micaceus]|uniref:PARP catalytic domain-containing protein n=1 Tax=Coprinellus micaceus TaxID=71717 RepID=A0A4Y7TAA0_COPMI|nr:hypothetical protein FA13DRAFT_1689086 [Coprinellus micaceus]